MGVFHTVRIVGVIAELNPPHGGHQFLFDALKSMGYTHLVVALSGCFVQRGEVAIFSKWDRAKWALEMGADLVVSIPVVHSVSCAERFAKAGVTILSGVGVDAIGFGSECGDICKLREILSTLDSAGVREKLGALLLQGHSLAAARARALELVLGTEAAENMLSPNNILALEYIRAIDSIDKNITPVTVGRTGVGHDKLIMSNDFTSASMLRRLIFNNDLGSTKRFLPIGVSTPLFKAALDGYILNLDTIDTLILGKWRTMPISDIAILPDVSEGLEFRLQSAIKRATTTAQLLELAKTRRYTRARLRRILVSGLLGITDHIQKKSPEYIHVLGMSDKGADILKKSSMPQSASLSKLANISKIAEQMIRLESVAGDIYAMSTKTRQECGLDFVTPLAKVGKL